MENQTTFDLNKALRFWLDQLGQSPEVKVENLKELESHVRDSVIQLQTKGLSGEESFLIATHRAGSPAQLGVEFGKVNRSVKNILMHLLILVFFSVCCWFLWALLHFPEMMAHARHGRPSPGFTVLLVNCRPYLIIPPILAAAYGVWSWLKRYQSWVGFFAGTMMVLVLLASPILVAVLLPMVDFMNQLMSK